MVDKYRVVFAVTYDFIATSENEAIEKATQELNEDLATPAARKDLFGVNVEKL